MALGWRKEYLRYKTFFLDIQKIYRERGDIKMFLELLLSLAAVSVFGIFALRPTLLTIAGLYQEIKTKNQTLAQMETKITNLQAAQTTLIAQSAVLSLLETAVPDHPQPEAFIRQIRGLADKNALSISGFSVNKIALKGTEKEEATAAMSFSGTVSGSYPNLLSFLQDLEKIRMPVTISLFNLNLAKSEKESVLSLSVTGSVPYLTLNEKN